MGSCLSILDDFELREERRVYFDVEGRAVHRLAVEVHVQVGVPVDARRVGAAVQPVVLVHDGDAG